MPEHTEESHLKTTEGFFKHANFPNVLGAIVGKHIWVIKPQHNGYSITITKNIFLSHCLQYLMPITNLSI